MTEAELYVTFSLSLSLSIIFAMVKENQKKEERENVFPGSRDRFLFTTYYSSSSPLRLNALGNALFS
jgi:hypothetical protein